MTCRHDDDDPSCSSYPEKIKKAQALLDAATGGVTPDAENYCILQAEQVGAHLVIKANYPNCDKCKFEGNKIMVFLNTSSLDALRWKRIDPHFSDNKTARLAASAPSPVARFPGSPEGWKDAVEYAKGKKGEDPGKKKPSTNYSRCSECGCADSSAEKQYHYDGCSRKHR